MMSISTEETHQAMMVVVTAQHNSSATEDMNCARPSKGMQTHMHAAVLKHWPPGARSAMHSCDSSLHAIWQAVCACWFAASLLDRDDIQTWGE